MSLRVGFTMAEILLSLTIIGVVAAITLPSLTGNINERTWNTQRKALYARFSQAIALMPALNGYGTLRENTDSAGSTSIEDTAAETFITAGLSKVLKINNICDNEHLEDCGIPDKFTDIAGSVIEPFPTTLVGLNSMFNGAFSASLEGGGSVYYSYSQTDTKAAAFETANGESIVVYYSPGCVSDMGETSYHFAQSKICANFIYDLNGSKGPNSVGKDMGFITVLYPTDAVVVAPLPLTKTAGITTQDNAGALCKSQDSESRLPNRDEAAAMFCNKKLLGHSSMELWTSSLISPTVAWRQDYHTGHRNPTSRNTQRSVWCIKR